MSKIKEFFERVLNSESPTSSRRFNALIGLALFSASVIVLLCGVDVNEQVLYATGGFTLTCLGLSTWKK